MSFKQLVFKNYGLLYSTAMHMHMENEGKQALHTLQVTHNECMHVDNTVVQFGLKCTMDPCLSELIGAWVYSDN